MKLACFAGAILLESSLDTVRLPNCAGARLAPKSRCSRRHLGSPLAGSGARDLAEHRARH